MRFLICTEDVNPCPPEAMGYLNLSDVLDPALLGVTPELILKAWAFGFGSVFVMWGVGYVIAIAVGLIRKV